MCWCRPNVRTPDCGRPECKAPEWTKEIVDVMRKAHGMPDRADVVAGLRLALKSMLVWEDDPSGEFDRLAREFYRLTGFMPRGKDRPAYLCYHPDEEKRIQDQWDEYRKDQWARRVYAAHEALRLSEDVL